MSAAPRSRRGVISPSALNFSLIGLSRRVGRGRCTRISPFFASPPMSNLYSPHKMSYTVLESIAHPDRYREIIVVSVFALHAPAPH